MKAKRFQRITILTYGSRGDVQPYLALGMGLARSGHAVRLAAPELFAETVNCYAAGLRAEGAPGCLEFFALPGDPAGLMHAAASPSRLARLAPTPVRMGLTVARHTAPVAVELIRAAREACEDAELVIHTLLTALIGHQIAQERGLADLAALVFPVFSATGAFPNPLFAPWPGWMAHLGRRAAEFGPRYHFLTHREFNRVFWHSSRLALRMLRRKHPDLPTLREWPFPWPDNILPEAEPAQPAPLIYGISRHALACPPEWGEDSRLTGYWFLDAPPAWQPPEGLARFLEAGPPPIFAGFGSVVSREARRLTGMLVEALRQTGQRGVLLEGWGGLGGSALPDWIYPIEEAPFDWLFPRVAAAIHHGGMGTTAAALRAGIPQMIVPFVFDQPFWGRQVQSLGVGPPPAPPARLSTALLARAITQMQNDEAMRARAAALGAAIRAEDGVANAVAAINRLGGS